MSADWHTLEVDAALGRLKVDRRGLSSAQAEARLLEYSQSLAGRRASFSLATSGGATE